MDDLEFVIVIYNRAFPVLPSDDVIIKLDGNALGRKSEMLKQLKKVKPFMQFFRLAIDQNSHTAIHIRVSLKVNSDSNRNPSLSVGNGLANFHFFALADGACDHSGSACLKLRDL